MRTDKKIVRLRQRNPLLTGSTIASTIGVSRQYVSRILKQQGLNNKQPHYKKIVVLCRYCQSVTQKNKKFCSNSICRQRYYHIPVQCSFCHYSFTLERGQIIQRHKRGMKNIYCSQQCYAKGQSDGIRSYGY